MSYRILDIEPKAGFISYHIEDLNNDGYKDIILMIVSDSSATTKHQLDFYLQTADGIPDRPDLEIVLSMDVVLFDFGDVSGDNTSELVYITPDGVFFQMLDFPGSSLSEDALSDIPSIFMLPNQSTPACWDFVRDLNGDGIVEILIPSLTETTILYRHPFTEDWQRTDLPIPAMAEFQVANHGRYSVGMHSKGLYSMPFLQVADYNEDGLQDLLAVYPDHLRVLCQDKSGKFSAGSLEQIPLKHGKLWDGSKIQRNRLGEESLRNHLMKVVDLDSDGMLDLVAIRLSTQKSILNPESDVRIFRGKRNDNGSQTLVRFSDQPDQILRTKGTQLVLDIQDINHDGKYDLLIPAVEIGFKNFVTMLLSRSIEVGVEVYLMAANGTYPDKPSQLVSMNMKFHYRGGAMSPVYELADFNGDGLTDILTSQEEKRLLCFYGDPENVFDSSVSEKFNIILPQDGEKVMALEMNGDTKSDLIINYDEPNPYLHDLGGKIRFLLSY
jgi:hypothetical protein